MRYKKIVPGIFRTRENRFVARVTIDEEEETVHVKNTGRCRELLVPGARVWLDDHGKRHPTRKTRYDLVAVEKGNLLINMDSQAPNQVFAEWAQASNYHDFSVLRPEKYWGGSRFDFYWESEPKQGFIEVKGVTLEEGGHARFPDAPTERGLKHVQELISAHEQGYCTEIFFVLQMQGMVDFSPNDDTDPDFGNALRKAAASGVGITAMECAVTPDTLEITDSVPVIL